MNNSQFCFLVQLGKGYPLPALRNMELENTQLQILKVRDELLKKKHKRFERCILANHI